jgi:hypothetical protein
MVWEERKERAGERQREKEEGETAAKGATEMDVRRRE